MREEIGRHRAKRGRREHKQSGRDNRGKPEHFRTLRQGEFTPIEIRIQMRTLHGVRKPLAVSLLPQRQVLRLQYRIQANWRYPRSSAWTPAQRQCSDPLLAPLQDGAWKAKWKEGDVPLVQQLKHRRGTRFAKK